MGFEDWINIRAEFISITYIMWAYVAVTVAVFAGYIAFNKHRVKEYDATFEFALALCISWSFEALIRIWYTSLNVLRALDFTSISSSMIVSFIPGFLALGVVLGGAMHVHALVKAYKNGGLSIWRKWLIGLGGLTSMLILSYLLYHYY